MTDQIYGEAAIEKPTVSKSKLVIVTAHIFPPIPRRDYDWQAAFDDYEEGDILGHGRTEADAIIDLIMQWNDRAMTNPMSAEEAREALEFVDAFVEGDIGSYSHHAWIGAIKKLRPFVQAHADMLDRQTVNREAVKRIVMDYADELLTAKGDPDPNEATDAILALMPDVKLGPDVSGLVEALETIAKIVDDNLYHQREKIGDVRCIARNALSTFKGGEDE